MEIILDKSFINELSIVHTKNSIVLDRILTNKNNSFIINKKLLTYIEENLTDELFRKWENIFIYLSDNQHLISSNEDTLDSNKIFNEIYKKSDFSIILSSYSLKNASSLNKETLNDKLFISIMENSTIVFRPTDFTNQNEIINFFKQIFHYSKYNGRIILTSRHDNFNCALINELKLRFDQKDFWTTKKFTNCKTNSLEEMKKILGKQLRIFTTTNEYLHERQILMGNCILEFDDSFDKIDFETKTWHCTLSISQTLTLEKINSKKPYLKRL